MRNMTRKSTIERLTRKGRYEAMKQLFNTRILAVLALGALIGLTSTTVLPAQPWVSIGPAAATGGQVEGITNLPVAGAIEALAAHPTNPNILYIGGVNGGIFKTVNATAASPTWTPQTDAQASLSIGALEFDPTDGTFNTLVAGVGRTSSFLGTGGAHTGILRTTNGGATWTPIAITGVNVEVSGIAARGATIVVAAEDSDVGFGDTGVYRSTNGGATWTKISGAGGTGLPIARAFDMASDPTSTTRLFVIVRNTGVAGASGIYRSDDTGATWTKISNAAQDALLNGSSADANLAVGKAGPTTPNVFSAICAAATGALSGVHRTGNAAAVTPVWTALDLPAPTIHPGGQCGTHLSLVADPTNSNLVYIGGDRQGSPFPNGVGAFNFSGRLFRINAALAGGSQAQSLTHCTAPLAGCGGVTSTTSNSSPHADSREMVFDANGNLIEVDDGGIYRRTNPTSIGDWHDESMMLQTLAADRHGYSRLQNHSGSRE